MEIIISRIIGGIGNQFFQYAAAKALALRIGAELKLDLSEFDDYKIRNYELSNFNIDENAASLEEINYLKKKKLFKKTYFKEKKFNFNPNILKIKKSAYLEGYWQSEKYFQDFETEIKNDFTFKNLNFIKNQDIFDEILNTESVSVHIRLGDYLSEKNKKIYYICKNEYYENAMEYILQNTKNPVFYIFSDNIDLVENNYKFSFPVKILKTSNWQEDFYFMQNCKHNIIPNSSFSWAAAWLNKNPEKIIAAPRIWYSPNCKYNNNDIIPEKWNKINVSGKGML